MSLKKRLKGMRAKIERRAERAGEGPVLILCISNGAGHTRAAEAIASAIRSERRASEALVVNVADYMTRFARFTHVTAYLWLVRRAPFVWERVDRYQKGQTHTSPEWFYRRGCRRLFDFARELQPRSLVATEVGCCEVAALIKRDVLGDATPLVAVDVDYDADRAWVQDEVNLYCVASDRARHELVAHGARVEDVRVWGVPLAPEFGERARHEEHTRIEEARARREEERADVCRRFGLDKRLPLVLVAGGAEGLGRIEEAVKLLLELRSPAPQLIVMAGRNERLRRRLERVAKGEAGRGLRVLGWTSEVARLMRAADLLVSKCGNTFDEALASELPLVALEPPPGSERVQYELLDEWGTGRAARTLGQMVEAVADLLAHTEKLEAMRAKAREHRRTDAASLVTRWVLGRSSDGDAPDAVRAREVEARETDEWDARDGELVGKRG